MPMRTLEILECVCYWEILSEQQSQEFYINASGILLLLRQSIDLQLRHRSHIRIKQTKTAANLRRKKKKKTRGMNKAVKIHHSNKLQLNVYCVEIGLLLWFQSVKVNAA